MKKKDWSEIRSVSVHYGSVVTHYDNIEDAVRYAYSGTYYADGIKVVEQLNQLYSFDPVPTGRYYPPRRVAFVDEFGMLIPNWKIEEVRQQLPVKSYRRRKYFKFRQGPVEGIHCYKASRRYCQRISTKAEITENDFADNYDDDMNDYGIKVRGARKRSNLPTAWDDKPKPWGDKSWKKYRSHQWKDAK